MSALFSLLFYLSSVTVVPPSGHVAGSVLSRFDQELDDSLEDLIALARGGPHGTVVLSRQPADPRFFEPYSGRYWQISGQSQVGISSRSLWDRRLQVRGRRFSSQLLHYNSRQFRTEPLRIVGRRVHLAGSSIEWIFVVAQQRR